MNTVDAPVVDTREAVAEMGELMIVRYCPFWSRNPDHPVRQNAAMLNRLLERALRAEAALAAKVG